MQVGKKTKYGTRPHPNDAWGYTKELLVKRGEEATIEAVTSLFAEMDISDEIAASKWLIVNMNYEE